MVGARDGRHFLQRCNQARPRFRRGTQRTDGQSRDRAERSPRRDEQKLSPHRRGDIARDLAANVRGRETFAQLFQTFRISQCLQFAEFDRRFGPVMIDLPGPDRFRHDPAQSARHSPSSKNSRQLGRCFHSVLQRNDNRIAPGHFLNCLRRFCKMKRAERWLNWCNGIGNAVLLMRCSRKKKKS